MSKLGIWVDFQQKIVCTELRRQDLISFSEWAYDASDCAQRFSETSYLGYRIWAVPCMRLMRKHPSLSRALAVVVRWMVADIKHERGVSSQSHWMGRVVRRGIFWPANRLIGHAASLAVPTGQSKGDSDCAFVLKS
ncbi:hypothetical protein [Corticimicrobacter populi]|uniref:Uncharacterized protein n=1 Tax=Corticimicrobacter populi TaxID=2175229 RepID=A0A2V1K201_9BURK|nr:hypothetical protein [Corticimicrobacter populi]PWF22156.1 hypothetical protein DD235_12290 [Corticimicrobacter populi]